MVDGADKFKSYRHTRSKQEASPEAISNQDFLRQHLETIVKGVTLSTAIMNASDAAGQHEIAEVFRNWIGAIAHLVKETELEGEYRQVVKVLNEAESRS